MKKINFQIISTKTLLNATESIFVSPQSDKLLVTIIKKVPNPAYNLSVNSISSTKNSSYLIKLNLIAPRNNIVCTQVISYKSITVALDKKHIQTPYNFKIL